jgi:HlyD family secretion protein
LPEVRFAKVTRQRLVSTLATNGRIEPVDSIAVRAPAPGAVRAIHLRQGGTIRAGQVFLELESAAIRTGLAAAESRLAQARAAVERFERGGQPGEFALIESELNGARLELDAARRDHASIRRLVEKNAAPRLDADHAADRVRQIESRIRGLEQKRAALLPAGGREEVEARIREAEADVSGWRLRLEQTSVRAPASGSVYHLALRPGAYLNPGDLIAEIGRLDRLQALVYVDEPELGRVAVGMPVTITWDALPGKSWPGEVVQMPSQIVALGTRQVGEVRCRVESNDPALPAGSNINVEIRSKISGNALTLPKEALQSRDGKSGVFLLNDGKLAWREVETGISTLTQVEAVRGVPDGGFVALPGSFPLTDALAIKAILP